MLKKIAVHAVLEPRAPRRYLHMRIELLFHVVFLIFCLEVGTVRSVSTKEKWPFDNS